MNGSNPAQNSLSIVTIRTNPPMMNGIDSTLLAPIQRTSDATAGVAASARSSALGGAFGF